jgi:hypothetical protein
MIMRKLRGLLGAGAVALALLAPLGVVGAAGVAQARPIPTYVCNTIPFGPWGGFFTHIRGFECVSNVPPPGLAGPGFVTAPSHSGGRIWFCVHLVVIPNVAVGGYNVFGFGCRQA